MGDAPLTTPRLCAAVFLSSFCFFLAVPLVPLYLVELGPHTVLAGPTIAVSFALSALLSPVWAGLAQRFGPKPMMIRAAVLVSAAYGLSAWATSVDLLFMSRCLAGVASGFVPVATATLVRLSDEKRRSTDLGWLSSAKSAGALLGPALGGLLVWWSGSFRLAFAVAAAASLITVGIAASMPPLPPERSTREPTQESPRSSPRPLIAVALLLTFLLTTAGMLLQLWLPFALGETHGAVGAAGIVGAILACASAVTMVLAPVWGRLADRRRRGQVLVATVAVPFPLLAVLGLVSTTWGEATIFVACAAFGSEAVALLGGEVSRRLPRLTIGPYFGWSNTVTQAGSACAAGVVPALVNRAIDLPVWTSVILYAASSAVVLRIVRLVRVPALAQPAVTERS